MNYDETVALMERVRPVLEQVWKDHKDTLLGQSVRVGSDGVPEVVIAGREAVEGIPESHDGVRIVFEVRARAFLA